MMKCTEVCVSHKNSETNNSKQHTNVRTSRFCFRNHNSQNYAKQSSKTLEIIKFLFFSGSAYTCRPTSIYTPLLEKKTQLLALCLMCLQFL